VTGRRSATVVIVALVGALVALLAFGVVHQESSRSLDRDVAEGKRPAPPQLSLPLLVGEGHASLADWRGKVVVLNFWASWCTPCREETPLLQRWHHRLQRQGGTVLGVDVLDAHSDALHFVRQFGVTYPLLRDTDGSAARRFGSTGYPETVVLDRRGRVAALDRGPVDDGFMRRHVSPLLREHA